MIAQIRPADLADWLQQHAGARPVVLDVREPWEIRTASVAPEGFELVTIPMGVLLARLDELDKTRPVACLCHLGGRSMQVAMYLEHQGFAQVANIAGGIHAWSLELDAGVPMY
ncbi:MAG: sulfurtransferase [Comamonas sp. SCN 65-56]|uniref:rhodanese-like domain-containing protein n=1 Tax=Comamonas sp. SCN 65-56 TaxID=1660095 RepID=UPI000869BD07|nr:rhodanese-like domain-containing protein [Comamonas sp. SCN 65-56]ODS91950.1 MAG: sulfurtransferase [Comamonas sp. SCN 65-56]